LTGQKLEAEFELFPADLVINGVAQLLQTTDVDGDFQNQLLQIPGHSVVLMDVVHFIERGPKSKI
jgi:hypothetical protein